MANTVEAAENVSVRVDWIYKVLGDILKPRDHQKLINIANPIKEQLGPSEAPGCIG